MTAPTLAPALTTFLNAVNERAWRAVVRHGRGIAFEQYYGEARGDGTRPKLHREVECLSQSIRLAGPDRSRAVALWKSLDGGAKWKNEAAWVWVRHPDRDIAATYLTKIPVDDLRALVAMKWGSA